MNLERWAGLHGGQRTEKVTPFSALSTEKHSCPEGCSSGVFFPSTLSRTDWKSSSCHPAWWPWFAPLVCVGRTPREAEPHAFARCPGTGSVRGGGTPCRRPRGWQQLSTDIAPVPGASTSQGAWTKAQLDPDWVRSTGPGLARQGPGSSCCSDCRCDTWEGMARGEVLVPPPPSAGAQEMGSPRASPGKGGSEKGRTCQG